MAVFNGKTIMLAGIKSPCLYKHTIQCSVNLTGSSQNADLFVITTKSEKYNSAAEFAADLSNIVSMGICDEGVKATAFLITTSNIGTYPVLNFGYYYSNTTSTAKENDTSLKFAFLAQAAFSSSTVTQL